MTTRASHPQRWSTSAIGCSRSSPRRSAPATVWTPAAQTGPLLASERRGGQKRATWFSLDVRACMATCAGRSRLGSSLGLGSLLGDDLDAQVDALVADVDVGAGDQLVDLALMLAAKRARQGGGDLSRAGSAPPEPHFLSFLLVLSLTAGG